MSFIVQTCFIFILLFRICKVTGEEIDEEAQNGQFKSLSCIFNRNLCQWTTTASIEYDPKVISHSVFLTAPSTYPRKSKNFVNLKKNEPSIVLNTDFQWPKKVKQGCLEVEFYAVGRSKNSLFSVFAVVKTETHSETRTLAEFGLLNVDDWQTRHIYLPENMKSIRLQTRTLEWIAFSSFSAKAGPCPTHDVCTFEPGQPCHLLTHPKLPIDSGSIVAPLQYPPFDSDGTWLGLMSPSWKIELLPVSDATTLSVYGRYLIFKQDKNRLGSINQRLTGPEVIGINEDELTFSVYIWNQNEWPIMEIRYLAHEDAAIGEEETVLWSSSQLSHSYSSFQWQQVLIPLHGLSDGRIYVQVQYSDQYPKQSSIAIDDFALQASQRDHNGNCNFEKSFCGYFQPADLHFTRGFGRLMADKGVDFHLLHYTRKQYAYLDLTAEEKLTGSQTARLVSPLLIPCHDCCAHVDYVLYNQERQNNVFLIQVISLKKEQLLYQDKVGLSVGSSWKSVFLTVSTAHPFHLTFSFLVSSINDQVPLLAIRSISLQRNPCNSPPLSSEEDLILSQIECSFENDFCEWKEENENQKHWKIVDNKAKLSSLYLPIHDSKGINIRHSGYVYIGNFERIHLGRLVSPVISVVGSSSWPQPFCLSYAAYNSPQRYSTVLTIYLRDPSLNTINNLDRISPSIHWHKRMHTIHLQNKFQIIIQAQVGRGWAAVHNVQLHLGHCLQQPHPDRFCDFETSECLIHVQQDTRNLFTVRPASQLGIYDHSTASSAGNVLSIRFYASYEKPKNQISKFTIPIPNTEKHTLRFWTNVHADCTLEVLLKNSEEVSREILVQHQFVKAESVWYLHETFFQASDNDESLQFEFTYRTDGSGFVAFDDLALLSGWQPLPSKCDFEHQCMWNFLASPEFPFNIPGSSDSIIKLDSLNALIRQMASQTDGRIPVDHTHASRDGALLTFQGKKKAMVYLVKQEKLIENACLHIALFMSAGQANGEEDRNRNLLHVLVANRDQSKVRKLSSTLHSGIDKEVWRQFHIPLALNTLDFETSELITFYVLFESLFDNELLGIDDLWLEPKICESEMNEFQCDLNDPNSEKIFQSKVCNFIQDCSNGRDEQNCGDCRFETNICNYVDESADITSENSILSRGGWQRMIHLPEYSKLTEPIDHPILHFHWHLEQDSISKISFLKSPLIRMASADCRMEFRYETNQLDLLGGIATEKDALILWSHSRNTQNLETASIQIGRMIQPFSLIISSIVYSIEQNQASQANEALIESIRLIDCALPLPNSTDGHCPQGQFYCENRVCIDFQNVCDFVDNCGDFSDEKHCSWDIFSCNFDHDVCDWSLDDSGNDQKSGFILKQSFNQIEFGPTRDHTNNQASGSFLLLDTIEGQRGNVTGILSGGHLNVKQDCHLRLFYMLGLVGQCSISVNARFEPDELRRNVYALPVNQRYEWVSLSVPMDKLGLQGFADISLLAECEMESYLAVDDLTFTQSCYEPDQQAADCNFGTDTSLPLCNWKFNNEPSSALINRSMKLSSKLWFGPPKPPSNQISEFLMFIHKQAKDSKKEPVAYLTAPLLRVEPTQKWVYVRFYYYQNGVEFSRLTLKEENAVIWQRFGSQGRIWNDVCLPVQNRRQAKFYAFSFKIEILGEMNQIAIANFSVSFNPCDQSVVCNFDQDGTCPHLIRVLLTPGDEQLQQGTGMSTHQWKLDNLGWKHSSQIETKLSIQDHSTRTDFGGFLYFKQNQAKTALRVRPEMDSKARCIRFWLNSFSENAETNKKGLFIAEHIPGNKISMITHNWRGVWKQMSISIAAHQQLQLESYISSGTSNVVHSIDHFSIEKGDCEHKFICDPNYPQSCILGPLSGSLVPIVGQQFWSVQHPDDFLNTENDIIDSIVKMPSNGRKELMFTYLRPENGPNQISIMHSKAMRIQPEGQCLLFKVFLPLEAEIFLIVSVHDGQKSKQLKRVDRNLLKELPEWYNWASISVHVPNLETFTLHWISIEAKPPEEWSQQKKDSFVNSVALKDFDLKMRPCLEEEEAKKKTNSNPSENFKPNENSINPADIDTTANPMINPNFGQILDLDSSVTPNTQSTLDSNTKTSKNKINMNFLPFFDPIPVISPDLERPDNPSDLLVEQTLQLVKQEEKKEVKTEQKQKKKETSPKFNPEWFYAMAIVMLAGVLLLTILVKKKIICLDQLWLGRKFRRIGRRSSSTVGLTMSFTQTKDGYESTETDKRIFTISSDTSDNYPI